VTFQLGSLFFNAEAPDIPRHPWIVLSDPGKNATAVVLVNLSTKLGPDNPPLIVEPGEHRALSQRSYVRFEMARRTTLEALEKGLAANVLTLSTEISTTLLERIQQGLVSSRHVSRELKTILTDQGFAKIPR
jgi:hypothetical protein